MQTTAQQTLRTFSMESLLQSPHGQMQQFSSPMPDREGLLRMVITDTMGVIDGIMHTTGPVKPLQHYNDRPMVEMNFMLQGAICQDYGSLLRQYTYTRGYHNLLFNPYCNETNTLVGSGDYRIFSVHFMPEHIKALFSNYTPELAMLAEKIDKGAPFVLHAQPHSLPAQSLAIFETFWNAPASTSMGKLYYDSRVLELLAHQCSAILQPPTQPLSRADLEKVHAAKDLLLQHLAAPPSFTALAKSCGLNEFKLKQYFRQVFNTTVFGYLQEARLARAKAMLVEGEQNISEIAYTLGYAHPQHFQRAFKKRFGITPGKVISR